MLLGIVAAAAALPTSSTNVPLDTDPPGVTKRTSDDFAKRAAAEMGACGVGDEWVSIACVFVM